MQALLLLLIMNTLHVSAMDYLDCGPGHTAIVGMARRTSEAALTRSMGNNGTKTVEKTSRISLTQSQEENLKILYSLIKNGAPLDQIRSAIAKCTSVNGSVDENNNTPLHAAASLRKVAICTLLLERGASANASNESGTTPRDIARSSSNAELKELFEAYKGKA